MNILNISFVIIAMVTLKKVESKSKFIMPITIQLDIENY